jgi:hypothetical protein
MLQEIKDVWYVVVYFTDGEWQAVPGLLPIREEAMQVCIHASQEHNCKAYWRALDLAHATAEISESEGKVRWIGTTCPAMIKRKNKVL